jgi:predicted DNA-binding transcriptional regulator YafY
MIAVRADRLLSILLLLQTNKRITASKLAEMMDVSERTIYRDLDALQSAGIPIYAERGPGGGCSLVDGYRTNLTGLTESEIRTLFAPGVHGPLADLGLGEALEGALLKLLAALPSTRRHDAERVRQRILLDSAGWFRSVEPLTYLRLVQEAVWQDRKLHMAYRRADGVINEREVDPYGLVAKANIWYVVCASESEMRVFRISRIQSASLSRDHFVRPEDFNLAAYWMDWCSTFESSVGRYSARVRVAPELLPVLPRIFGDWMYTVIEQADPPDSKGWITINMSFDTMDAARMSILGFGALAEVIEPLALRQSVIETAAQVTSFYAEVAHG